MLTNPLFIAYVVLIIAAMVVSVIAAKNQTSQKCFRLLLVLLRSPLFWLL